MFCAMDFSGNQESGNCKYPAAVACTAEFLDPIVSGANLRNTVRSTAGKKARRQGMLAKLDAGKSECLVLCLKTESFDIVKNSPHGRGRKRPPNQNPPHTTMPSCRESGGISIGS